MRIQTITNIGGVFTKISPKYFSTGAQSYQISRQGVGPLIISSKLLVGWVLIMERRNSFFFSQYAINREALIKWGLENHLKSQQCKINKQKWPYYTWVGNWKI